MKKIFLSLTIALLSCAGFNARAAYPAVEDFVGDYRFSATLQLEDKSFASILADSFVFSIEQSYSDPNIIDFISNTFIATVYDSETGLLKLQTNTVRYGQLPSYRYLGIADAEANWSGMGAASKTPVFWQIEEDGKVSIPDFTLVDYSKYSSTGKVTVIARYSDCKAVSLDEDDEEVVEESFEGHYEFKADVTDYIYETTVDENGCDNTVLVDAVKTVDAPLFFTINEYGQISKFNDEYDMPAEQLNSLRNKGYVSGMNFVMDVDTYNGIGWNYDTENEDAAKTEAMLFNNITDNGWNQGRKAFTLTKTEDGSFTLTPFTIWFRTMENQMGYGDVVNRMRVFRIIRKYENPTYVGNNEMSSVDGFVNDNDDAPRFFNLQGFEVKEPLPGNIYVKIQGNKATLIKK